MKKLVGPFHQLLTLEGMPPKGPLKNDQMPVIRNGGILCEGGKILSVGEFDKLKTDAGQIEEITGPAVAMPGWVDCHTHMLWGGSRAGDFEKRNSGVSYGQILAEGGGIFDTVRRTREAGDESLRADLRNRLSGHLRDGITTVEIKSGYGLDAGEELRMLRLVRQAGEEVAQHVVGTFLGAHVCPQDYTKEEYLTFLSCEVFPRIREEALTNRVDIFVEQEAFSVDLAFPYLQKARSQGFDLTVHANQFTGGGAFLAAQLGARSADHLEHIEGEELRALADSDTVAVALPGASIGLGAPFTPVRKLLDAGAALAIATDWNPGSAPQGDLLTQTALLTTYGKLSTAEAFAGVTYRAAYALGLTDRGILGKGYVADWVVYPTDDYREILYQMGRLRPSKVYAGGKEVS